MKIDDFLTEIVSDRQMCQMKAIELQKLIRECRKQKKELTDVYAKRDRLRDKVWALEAKIEVMQLEKPIMVDLRA